LIDFSLNSNNTCVQCTNINCQLCQDDNICS
jgi:hypothetical protein